MQICDCLCSNLPSLAQSIAQLAAFPPERGDPSLLRHRNALLQHVFFMSWLSAVADEEAGREAKAKDATKGGGYGGCMEPARAIHLLDLHVSLLVSACACA